MTEVPRRAAGGPARGIDPASVVLIDGHSVAYRSYFAFIRKPLRTAKGRNTSAVFGFANTLRRVLAELEPEFGAVVFDAPGKTFRHERFERYKIQRPSLPDELREQLPAVKELVEAWGLVTLEVPGVEADDVIGTLARRAAAEGRSVAIVTSDKDMLQLVGERIVVYDPWKEVTCDAEEVRQRLGVGPEQVPDFLALAGDASDNVPGVPGVGPKRALDILRKHGGLAAALEADDRVRSHADAARLSRELVEIQTDVELALTARDLKPAAPDLERLARLFEEMEFRSLLAELRPKSVLAVKVVDRWDAGLSGDLACFGFACDGDGATWASPDGEQAIRLESEQFRRLAASRAVKAGHEVKEQFKALRRTTLELSPPLFDNGVAAWLIDPNRKRYGLEQVVGQFLDVEAGQPGPAAQAALAFRLHQVLEPRAQAMGLSRVAGELEMPLIPVLAAMEERGVRVDMDVLQELEAGLAQEQARLEKDVWQAAGGEFNLASPRQLAQVLFGRLKLARGRRTKTGYSTDQTVLAELADRHPVVGQVLRWRELAKLGSTYLRPLRRLADPKTGRVHTTFDQTGTSTGRLSATEPNLQNVPIRSPLGRRIRHAFVAEPGRMLVSADYSQIELRVLAHLSRDERLCEAFARGEDIHVATASAILNVPPESVSEEQRRVAKMVNYGIIYGMGDYGLAWRMDLPRDDARAFVESYLTEFAGVARWRDATLAQARQDGFVRTIAGRIRPVPEIASPNRATAEAAGRAALNAPVQGSAADIVKQAMIRIDARLKARADVGIVLQVHDELLLEAAESSAADVADLVRSEMEQAWRLDVPLTVAVGVGRNWGEVH